MPSTFGGSSQPGGCPPRAVAGGWTKAVRPSRALGPATPHCRHEPPPGVAPSAPAPPLYTWEPREGKSGSHACAGHTQERAASWLSLRGRWSVPGSGPSQSPRGTGVVPRPLRSRAPRRPPLATHPSAAGWGAPGWSMRWKGAGEAEGEWAGRPSARRPASGRRRGGRQAGSQCLLAVRALPSGISRSQGSWQRDANYCFSWC